MGKKKTNKFNHLADPQTYNYADFKSINGGVSRRYFYNKGSRSDVFGRTSAKELWSNPYTAWEKYNTSGLMPQGLTPSAYQTIRHYNSISYNPMKEVENANPNRGGSKRKKVVPKNTMSSGELLDINLKVEKSKYNNTIRNRLLSQGKTDLKFSPSFFYAGPTKYTRDYFVSTLDKGNKSENPTIADLEKNVSSQYWIPKSKLPNSQGYGLQVYQKSIPNNIDPSQWKKFYPNLPFNYYNFSFL